MLYAFLDKTMPSRYELSDRQWDTIKGFLPGKKGDPGGGQR